MGKCNGVASLGRIGTEGVNEGARIGKVFF